MSSLRIKSLAREILRSDNPFQLVGSAVSGALAYVFIIAGGQALATPGQALSRFSSTITSAFSSGANRVTGAVETASSNAWSASLDLGIFQLPYNLFAVLLTAVIIAYGLAWWRDE